jgi:sodium-coupled neutral amino acid transporter 11
MLSASFNFINSIVGAGIIGMPLALRQAGFGFGIMLIIFIGIITDYSVRILIRAGVTADKRSYQGLVEHALGKWGYRALTFGQLFFPLFGMIAYGIIVGQTMPKIFDAMLGESFLSHRRPVIAVLTLGLMMPLSMNKVCTAGE